MPERIQQRRTNGWRKPENTVSVARPSRYGNPFKVGPHLTLEEAVSMFRGMVTGDTEAWLGKAVDLRLIGVDASAGYVWPYPVQTIVRDLAGKNLMCFCPLDQPCHADVLLELANAPTIQQCSSQGGSE